MFVVESYLIMKVREGEKHLYKKNTRGLTRINAGLEDCLYIGNLDSLRDWGHAKDFVKCNGNVAA